jgi:hypothetical protein
MNKNIFFTLSLLSILVILSGCGGGGGGGSMSAPPGANPGVPSVIKLLDVQNVAQTNSTIYLKAKVLDGTGKPVAGQTVFFTKVSGTGTLSAASTNTDGNGIATVTLNSPVSGFSTVLAEITAGAGQIRDRQTVFFTSNITFETSMSLSVDSVPGDGIFDQPSDFVLFESTTDNTVEVLATVFDIAGFPVGGGWPVSWVTDHAEEVVFIRTDTITDLNGQARAIVQVVPDSLRDTDTTVNIGAFAANGAFNMVTLFLNPVTVNTVVVTANPSTVASGGTSTITAYATTTAGTPVPDGTIVNFTATGGSAVGTPFAVSDGGVATTTLTAPTVTSDMNISVTASVGGKTGSAIISVTAPVIPPTPLALTVVPATASILSTGGTATFTISGGTSPYTTTSSDPLRVYDTASGDGVWNGSSVLVHVPAGATAGTVTLTINDSVGAIKTVTVTIIAVAPTVVSTVPADEANGVLTTADITVTFSKDMDSSTIVDANFNVHDDTGGSDYVSGCSPLVTYDAPSKTATLSISTCAALNAGSAYTVTLSTSITDSGGLPLAAPYVFNFTTAAP